MERLKLGLYGDFKILSEDLKELRLKSGQRIYFYQHNDIVLLLLSAGNKQRQYKDIAIAKEYIADFKNKN